MKQSRRNREALARLQARTSAAPPPVSKYGAKRAAWRAAARDDHDADE